MAICGYGPVGSLCSLLMADYGYKVLLIDKNIGTSPTARAINTDGEQLRIFDKFGLAEKIVENSNQIEKIHFSKKVLNQFKALHKRWVIHQWDGLIKFYFINLS